jgi:hypothetical protein
MRAHALGEAAGVRDGRVDEPARRDVAPAARGEARGHARERIVRRLARAVGAVDPGQVLEPAVDGRDEQAPVHGRLDGDQHVEGVDVHRGRRGRAVGDAPGGARRDAGRLARRARDRDALALAQLMAVADELERRVERVATVAQPAQLRRGRAQRRDLVGREQLRVLRVRTAAGH